MVNSKILIHQILGFPNIIKYLIIFIYNCTCQNEKRRKAFIQEIYGMKLFKKIMKILIYEHKRSYKEKDEVVKSKANALYKKGNKKQVRMIGEYVSDSDNDLNDADSEIDNDKKTKNQSDKNSESGKKNEATPKSREKSVENEKTMNEDPSQSMKNDESVSPSPSQKRSNSKMSRSKKSLKNMNSNIESTFAIVRYVNKKKLNFRADPKEVMSPYHIEEFDEWFIRWFALLVKNTNLLAPKEEHPETVFSLFPKMFNYFMSTKERKDLMHRFEFIHHKGINSIKFIKLVTKKLNYIGMDDENDEDEDDDMQIYPQFVVSLSSSQTQLLQLLSDVIHSIFLEKSIESYDIRTIFRNDLCLFLWEAFNHLIDQYEKSFLNELILKRCFRNTAKYVNEIEYDDFDSSDEEKEGDDRELEKASDAIKELMATTVEYHSHVMRGFMSFITIFTDVTSSGVPSDKIKATLSDNAVLHNTLKLIQICDYIIAALIDNKIIKKGNDSKVPVLDMNMNNDSGPIHPLHAFILKCFTLVSNLIRNNPRAVRVFEREKDKLLLLTAHTKGGYDTDAIKELAEGAIKLLTTQSIEIKNRFQELT